ncbi:hypothetical protein [Brevundimonas sp. UBA7534]|uniref:hypothetical protein n=1 Tax=Brevundimonas sp. UBA7534 TaxID=1946138 RepID=UPI0025C1AE0F|nr:hypothetical protein [Brevundimonas sp. UBA7534]
MPRSILLLLISFATAAPAVAWCQDDPSDWALTRAPEAKAVVATISFTNGLSLIARCQDGVYDIIIQGLPEVAGATRALSLQVGEGGEAKSSTWSVGTNRSVAFSRIPAIVARDLAGGGALQITVPPDKEGERRIRYVMDIEPSSTAIEQTLTACGRPLVDPRMTGIDKMEGNGQDGLPAFVQWRSPPRPTFPEPVGGRMPTRGYVVLTCLAKEDGSLTDCQTESEVPAGYNLGRSVERALPRARVSLTDEAAAAGIDLQGRMISFSVNFELR